MSRDSSQIFTKCTWERAAQSHASSKSPNKIDGNFDEITIESSWDSEEEEDLQKEVEVKKPIEFMAMSEDEDEDKVVYLDESDPEILVKEALRGNNRKMTCLVCNKTYIKKDAFLNHRIRHFAIDHYKCPVCAKGFVTLECCKSHESVMHTEKGRNGKLIIQSSVSTSCYPYVGPKVEGTYGPYEVELKYGRKEKNGSSQVIAKMAIAQRDRNIQLEGERMAERRLLERKRNERRSRGRPSKRTPVTNIPQISNVRSMGVVPLKQPLPSDSDVEDEEYSENKFYLCALCSFCSSHNEIAVKSHCAKEHPDAPLADAIQTISLGLSEFKTEKIEKKVQGVLQKAQFLSSLGLRPLMDKEIKVKITPMKFLAREKKKLYVCFTKTCHFNANNVRELINHTRENHPMLEEYIKERYKRKKMANLKKARKFRKRIKLFK